MITASELLFLSASGSIIALSFSELVKDVHMETPLLYEK